MPTFILKTEPSAYSFADLVRDKIATWDGITSNAALAHLRTVTPRDELLIYHTGQEKAIVGLAMVVSPPREDPNNPGRTATGKPRLVVIDIAPIRAAPSQVSLAAIKADKRFATFALVKQARLSVVPVPPDLDRALRMLAGL